MRQYRDRQRSLDQMRRHLTVWADEGAHRFSYALLPHDGRWWAPEVQAEADLMVDPLRHAPAGAMAPVIAPLRWSGLEMRLHALKPAEDGQGYVLRLSEAAGRRGALAVSVPEGRKVVPVDGLERPLDPPADGLLGPFSLRSLRF